MTGVVIPGNNTATAQPPQSAVPVARYLLIALAALLLFCYYPMLVVTGRILVNSDDMAYGFFAPIVALYIAWESRDILIHRIAPSSSWSIPFIAVAAFIGTVATLSNSSSFARVAFLLSIAGCLLFIGGWPTLRRFVFPLALLLFTFPVPAVLYGEMTQPLQLLASRLAEATFEMIGYSVVREGNIIRLAHMNLSVVEACSGLKSLITLFFFCLVYSYFFETRNWLRAILVMLAVPSAIAVNALRITATGVLGKYDSSWTLGVRHEIVGWTAFTIGFLLVLLAHYVIRRFAGPPQRLVVRRVPAGTAPGRWPLALTALVVGIFVAQAASSRILKREPYLPSPAPLASLPATLGDWNELHEEAIEPDAIDMLGPDDYIGRLYQTSAGSSTAPHQAEVFIAYYKTQLRAKNAHDPKVCLPGAGWNATESHVSSVPVRLPNGSASSIPVNYYKIRKDNREQVVLYWFQTFKSVYTQEQQLAAHRVWDSLVDNRTDMALVRITVPSGPDAGDAGAAAANLAAVVYNRMLAHFPPTKSAS